MLLLILHSFISSFSEETMKAQVSNKTTKIKANIETQNLQAKM